MSRIDYLGISPQSIELVNSEEFRTALEAFPILRLVTPYDEDEGWEEGQDEDDYTDDYEDDDPYIDLTWPLSENHVGYVAVIDRDNDELLWVLYDDCAVLSHTNPAFIEILRIMDAFSLKTHNSRLFLDTNVNLDVTSPAVLAATYDFSTGRYII